jgi:hypothetical protein
MYCRDRDLVSVCEDVVIRGGIIKLQERLLNEGRSQKRDLVHTDARDFIRMEEIENIWKNSGKFGSICFF